MRYKNTTMIASMLLRDQGVKQKIIKQYVPS